MSNMEVCKRGIIFCSLFASLLNLSFSQNDNQVCYRDLGCFSTKEPWSSFLRPIPAPMAPEKIKTRIFLYSRPNSNDRNEILLRPSIDLNGALFNKALPTAIIIHGYNCNGVVPWMLRIKDAYLSRNHSNVMLVDWGPGAMYLSYFQATSNARVVGSEIARLIKELRMDPKKIHLIGHSLGAHISSYVGKLVKGTARITALDPAQPAFEGYDRSVRLESGDAELVEVLHTDARPFRVNAGLGMMDPVGHVDFYFNGGFDQPGCLIPKKSNKTALARAVQVITKSISSCSHLRVTDYFLESLNNTAKCVFWGHKAPIDNNLRSLKKVIAISATCSRDDCIPLSKSSTPSLMRGSFVVTTNDSPPYCNSKEVVTNKV